MVVLAISTPVAAVRVCARRVARHVPAFCSGSPRPAVQVRSYTAPRTCVRPISTPRTFSPRRSSVRSVAMSASSGPDRLAAPAAPALEMVAGFPPTDESFSPKTLVYVGTKEALGSATVRDSVPEGGRELFAALVGDLSADSSSSALVMVDGKPVKLVAAAVPEKASRHCCPAQPKSVSGLVGGAAGGKGDVAVLVVAPSAEYVPALGAACGRAFPLFTQKTVSPPKEGDEPEAPRTVRIGFAAADGSDVSGEVGAALLAADGVRTAARIVDTPPEEMSPAQFVTEAEELVSRVEGVELDVVAGTDLRDRGFGGIWGVGKAAAVLPRLIHLKYDPDGATKRMVWVGKGIVYDTGGLSIKTGGFMCGMKGDCGGAAAVLGAFEAAVRLKPAHSLHAVLCVAENAIGPLAFRNDDILTLYSGKTVEINNTDAEGRLVLGDGVAFACKDLSPDVIVDVATLTGAQLITTGKTHAGILANTAELESSAVAAGILSGDVVHPMLYAPELHAAEFKSKVADMKNSVKDRMNAQASCAGSFVESHLSEGYEGGWLHCDIAGPAWGDDRGTGYGVGLLLQLSRGYA